MRSTWYFIKGGGCRLGCCKEGVFCWRRKSLTIGGGDFDLKLMKAHALVRVVERVTHHTSCKLNGALKGCAILVHVFCFRFVATVS